jgi:hypothetical protein
MYKWFLILMALYLVGDPGLVYLEQMGGTKDLVVALIVSLAIMPWVTAQFDN